MKELDFDYFTTTLTVSPHKNSQVINDVGREIEEAYGISYLPTDFKKGNGFLTSTKMAEATDSIASRTAAVSSVPAARPRFRRYPQRCRSLFGG